ncbi:MAG: RNA ligase family protein [Myxococcaceae bacterium]
MSAPRQRGELVLGHKAYLKIPHLPGSRTGSKDRFMPREQARWLTHACKSKHVVVVQEKLDGSCVAVTKKAGDIIALGREGYRVSESQNPGRLMFGRWVETQRARFDSLLREGEWVVGEWLALAHSTRYALKHEAFVLFDLCELREGAIHAFSTEVTDARVAGGFARPHVVHRGDAISVEAVDAALGAHGFHGALDRVEGAVWRLEKGDGVVLRGKFVRPGKTDGALLPENSGQPAVWNWRD